MRKIIQSKITNSFPTQVNLGNMNIRDDELEEIINVIKNLRPNIENLFLHKNHINDEGVFFLLKSLESFPNLLFLDLQGNEIGKPGIDALRLIENTNSNYKVALHGNDHEAGSHRNSLR